MGGVVGDGDALVGTSQDDAAVQGEQGGNPVGPGAVVAGVEQGARGQRGGCGQALDLGVGEGGVVDHGGLRLAEEAPAVQVSAHHDARHRRYVGQEGAAGGTQVYEGLKINTPASASLEDKLAWVGRLRETMLTT